jgi:hypothetical protein
MSRCMMSFACRYASPSATWRIYCWVSLIHIARLRQAHFATSPFGELARFPQVLVDLALTWHYQLNGLTMQWDRVADLRARA